MISDIEMPKLNGFQLARAIREGKLNANVPMLAVSSRADGSYIEEGSKSGFNLYLEKLKPQVLPNAIAELTAKDRKAA